MIYVCATEMEARPLRLAMPQARIEICGVGLAASAASISAIIASSRADEVLILCGVAGSYDAGDVAVGEVVEVISETIEELPTRFAQHYHCEGVTPLRGVSSNSVNSSQNSKGAQIENMEGASFMALCQRHSRRGVQIRAISNIVGEPFEMWRVDEALEHLAASVAEFNQRGLFKQNLSYKLFISPCPNDTFIFEALINRRIDMQGLDFSVDYYDIDKLNELARMGAAEFIKVSAAAIPILYKDYRICASGAALGWGNGPLVVRAKGSTGALKRVAVPGLSTTATLLLKRYFPEVEEFCPMLFSSVAQAVKCGEVDGGVLIHEGRFTYESHGLELVADLGAMWEQELHMPLPLGVILMRRDLSIETQRTFERLVQRSLISARENPKQGELFITQHAQEMDRDVIERHIELFVNDFSLSLGRCGVAAIEHLTSVEQKLFL